MNWLNSLLRKPPESPGARTSPPRSPAPAPALPDPDALRRQLAAEPAPAAPEVLHASLGQALGARLMRPLPGDPPGVWCAAIRHCADKALALQWLQEVADENQLADIAGAGRYAEVRLAAAQRVTQDALLDTLARASKNKDKGVYRHCTEVLRGRREARERVEGAAAIARALQALLERAPVSVSHLLEIERNWNALMAAAPEVLEAPETSGPIAHCRALLARANARILEETESQRGFQAAQAALADLAGSARDDPWPAPGQIHQWLEQHGALAGATAGLPAWLAGSAAGAAFGEQLASLRARLDAWRADSDRVVTAEAYLADARQAAEAALAPGAAANPAPDASAWEALTPPENPHARAHLAAQWTALVAMRPAAPAPAREDEPPAHAAPAPPPPEPVDTDAVRGPLELLEQALEGGKLVQADSAARQIKGLLGTQVLEPRLDARLQRSLARLGELRGWAQWGATKKREDLIAAASQLRGTVAAGGHDVEQLAVAIPALREEWKRLNAQGPATKGQWEHFDRALAAAYVPVAAHHAEETERRNQAKAHREALLAAWESRIAGIDWTRPEPAMIDALRDEMLGQWRVAPHAGFRDERALRARFDGLVRALDARLDAARSAEVQRREELIAAVHALAELPDPREATARAKELQERWRSGASTLRLRRGEEQKLWQRFRVASDAVFARRDAERAALVAQREAQLQARAQRLADFAAIIAGDDGPALGHALAQFRRDWDVGSAEAGESAVLASQDRTARDLQRRAQQQMAVLRTRALEARFTAMAQAAAPAEGVAAEALAQGAAARAALLIDLEIALGLETPGAAAELRRRRQLEQLQNRFRPGPAAAGPHSDPEQLLVRWYAIPAPSDASQESRIAAVVHALMARARAAQAAQDKAHNEPPRATPRPGQSRRPGERRSKPPA